MELTQMRKALFNIIIFRFIYKYKYKSTTKSNKK